MDSINLLILTVYLLIVFYVFYKAYQSLENQLTVELDKNYLNEELEKNNLKGCINISINKMKPSYELSNLKTLVVTLKNDFKENSDTIIRVNWDESSIIDFDNSPRRTIRVTLTKGLTEVPEKQVPTPLTPNQKVDEELTDDQHLGAPLFKLPQLKKASLKGDPFYLRLSLNISEPGAGTRFGLVRCKLIPKKLRWTKALKIALTPPPKKKKKS